MKHARRFKECNGGLNFHAMLRFNLGLLIFALTLRLAISSELFKGLDQDPVNPGDGVNFYGKVQNTSIHNLENGLTLQHILKDFSPRNCSEAPEDSSCIQRGHLFQDPDFRYTIKHPVPCNFSIPYRNIDGTCNVPHIPIMGMADDCYFRFTPPYYDGVGGFRLASSGKPLPEPRDISLKIFKDRHRPEVNVSFQFLSFGQLVAHDLSLAVQPQTDCCVPENLEKEECKPISVRPDDPFYSQYNQTCLQFRRSEVCPFGNSPNREQKNGATAALDASVIYGVSKTYADELRNLDGTGTLKSTGPDNGCLLPAGKAPDDIFCTPQQAPKCFLSGDYRVNQHASLTSMHTIWMREHNRLAKELKKINPHWGEETLFYEARKILIAELQCITYQDFLPLLLPHHILREFDMVIHKGSQGSLFYPIAALAVWHEFAHASFRLHSMVPTDIGVPNLRFKDTFSNPDLIREGYLSVLVNGSQHVPAEKYDRYMVKDLSNYLYEKPGVPYGQDLAALNVQRGRDHGMAPYVIIVRFCSDRSLIITSFEDLIKFDLMTPENVEALQKVYKDVRDVDMWVGMQLEKPMPGSLMGPSAVCVVAKQFFFTQKADRLFFNHEGLMAPFTADQRSNIKNVSLGRILCDTTEVKQMPNNTFRLPGPDNPIVSCETFPKIDLSLWKENKPTAQSS